MLVDDEEGIRTVVRKYLEDDGHYVETAGDGVEALKKFKAANWNLVITDLIMPKLGGDDLAKLIKQIDPTIPLILLTGHVDYAADVRGERLPFDMVISKPFKYDTIHAAIASIQLRKDV